MKSPKPLFIIGLFFITSFLIAPKISAATNTAPILDSTKSPILNTITEDAGAPTGAVGTLISSVVDLASPSGQVDNVTDNDAGVVVGIAVSAINSSLTCYYSLDNGTSWSAIGSVSNSSARLLAADSDNRIYCQAGSNVNGSYSDAVTFHAWDQTSGTDGGAADASVSGGTSAFSTITDTIGLTVIAVNDAPTATNMSAAETYTEDTLLNLIDVVASDIDSATITATLTLSNSSAGTLSTATSNAVTSTYNAGTGVWAASGAIADVNLLLAGVTFTPTANFNSSFTITTNISDGALSINGSKAIVGISVNDAPVLDASKSPVLNSIAQNAGAPVGAVGTSVSNLVDVTPPAGGLDNVADVDSGASLGIAIVGSDTADFTCYYSTNNGTTWSALGVTSNTSARLLATSNGRIYCNPGGSAASTYASAITFRAWDQTSGSNGGVVSTATNGGASAFSTATDTASIIVTSGAPNTAPVAVDDSYVMDEDSPRTGLFVLNNDTDVDNNVLTLVSLGSALHGDLGILDNAAVYTPTANYCGSDTFDYVVSDGNGGTDTGTVSITVSCINDAPVAVADTSTVNRDLGGVALLVLSNDTDVDNDPLTITSVSSTNHGGIAQIILSGQQIGYTPPTDYLGDDMFTYTISDGHGGTDTGNVTIHVTNSPETVIISKSSSNIDSSTATFEFTSNESPVTFECAIDTGGGPVFTACTSPWTSTLFTPGNHYTFLVRAKNAYDNTDQTPAQVSWTVSNMILEHNAPFNGETDVARNTPISFDFADTVRSQLKDGMAISVGSCSHECPTFNPIWSDADKHVDFENTSGNLSPNTTYSVELTDNNGIRTDTLYSGAFKTASSISSIMGHVSSGTILNYQIPQQVVVHQKYHFPRTLKFGLTGDDVVTLQKFLGITPPPSKHFGLLTKAALIKYQKEHGLDADGIAGLKTFLVIEGEMGK
jgi:hypothetical protein